MCTTAHLPGHQWFVLRTISRPHGLFKCSIRQHGSFEVPTKCLAKYSRELTAFALVASAAGAPWLAVFLGLLSASPERVRLMLVWDSPSVRATQLWSPKEKTGRQVGAMMAGTLARTPVLAHKCRNIVLNSPRAALRPGCCHARQLQVAAGEEQSCVEHSGRLESGHSSATHPGALREQGCAAPAQ